MLETAIVVRVTDNHNAELMGPEEGKISIAVIGQEDICMVVLRVARGRSMAAFSMLL